jgi:hypothetical protein
LDFQVIDDEHANCYLEIDSVISGRFLMGDKIIAILG